MAPGIEIRRETPRWHAVKCPFHGDRAASASYNPSLQRFKCHACDVGGDGYDLIQQVERCDFMTALARATEICGGNFTAVESDDIPQRSKLTSRRSATRSRLVRQRYSRSRLQR